MQIRDLCWLELSSPEYDVITRVRQNDARYLPNSGIPANRMHHCATNLVRCRNQIQIKATIKRNSLREACTQDPVELTVYRVPSSNRSCIAHGSKIPKSPQSLDSVAYLENARGEEHAEQCKGTMSCNKAR